MPETESCRFCTLKSKMYPTSLLGRHVNRILFQQELTSWNHVIYICERRFHLIQQLFENRLCREKQNEKKKMVTLQIKGDNHVADKGRQSILCKFSPCAAETRSLEWAYRIASEANWLNPRVVNSTVLNVHGWNWKGFSNKTAGYFEGRSMYMGRGSSNFYFWLAIQSYVYCSAVTVPVVECC